MASFLVCCSAVSFYVWKHTAVLFFLDMTKGRNWELQHGDSSIENWVRWNVLFLHTWLPGHPTPLLQWLRVWIGDVYVLVGKITFSEPALVLSALRMTELLVWQWAEQLCAVSYPFDTGFLRKMADSFTHTRTHARAHTYMHTHTPFWFKITSISKRLILLGKHSQSAWLLSLLPPFRSQSSILLCPPFFTRLSEPFAFKSELWT